MKKQDRTKRSCAGCGRSAVRDWQSMLAGLREAIDWALDIAKTLARDYDEEIEAIERTRSYLHAWLAGREVDIDVRDIYTTLAVLFAAIEIDLGIDSAPLIAPLRSFPPVLHLPGAAHDERPTAVIRRFPHHRNAAAGFVGLAA